MSQDHKFCGAFWVDRKGQPHECWRQAGHKDRHREQWSGTTHVDPKPRPRRPKCPHCKKDSLAHRPDGAIECLNMNCPLYYRRSDGWRVRLEAPKQ